ncbi:hypothetical protein AAFF_G00001230 [Aldrovandia affinis]|uniref:Uncharacterized protein n=1 Tax=Aldrovandia affinis TaxID=143900 RepID=A0AAD7TCU2_9TELE|nr:hypothetical protein AAFF_G00001230 [Aldrovandia affinis]
MGHYDLVVWLVGASLGGHHRILEQLLSTGAKVIRDDWGGTPLHDATENEEIECFRILLRNEVDPTQCDRDGFTGADLAEHSGHYVCANYIWAMERCPSAADRSLTEIPTEEAAKREHRRLLPLPYRAPH